MNEGRKVLLIDDNEIALLRQQEMLTKSGFEVRGATDIEEFKQHLSDWTPDIILTDVNMPGMTGVELCHALKRSYESAHIPIVLFSSLEEDELAELAEQCEADGFLSKSEGFDKLAKELEALCEEIAW